jgi:hypothetical protein
LSSDERALMLRFCLHTAIADVWEKSEVSLTLTT